MKEGAERVREICEYPGDRTGGKGGKDGGQENKC